MVKSSVVAAILLSPALVTGTAWAEDAAAPSKERGGKEGHLEVLHPIRPMPRGCMAKSASTSNPSASATAARLSSRSVGWAKRSVPT